jgi:ABC-type glutathione transport system ATPase component
LTTDIDRLDLIQGFFDLRLPSPLGDAPALPRPIAVREGPNVWRDFDGVCIHWGEVTIGNIAGWRILYRYAHQSSGGQRQRAPLAGKLAIEPGIVLLSVPF